MNNNFYTDVRTRGDILYFTGFDSNNNEIVSTTEYSPVLYEKTDIPTGWKSIYGDDLKLVKFKTMKDANYYKKSHEDYFGFEKWDLQYLGYAFSNKPTINYDDLRIYSIDIETTADAFPRIENPTEKLLCITIVDLKTDKVITFSSQKCTFRSEYPNNEYYDYYSESEMIESFLSWWVKHTPHIITGWSSSSFDLPYIIARLDRLNPKYKYKLSPHGVIDAYKTFDRNNGREVYRTKLYGIQQLDYIELYKKFTYKMQTSYKLDNIASIELGDNKLDHSQYETFKEFYEKDYELFLHYNQKDAYLIKRLEKKLNLLKLAVLMAYDAKSNFEDCFSPIRVWDCIIFNYLNRYGIVIPGLNHDETNDTIVGGRVKEPKPGLYDWIVTFDLTSLYPSIIMGLNISPETLLDGLDNVNIDDIVNRKFKNTGDYSLAANGAKYRRDRNGFLPVLVDKIFKERKDYKKRMLSKKQDLESIEAELKLRGLK